MSHKEIYQKLAAFGRELLTKKSLLEGLPLIAKYAKEVIGAQRCSIFIYDTQKARLWTTLADGVEIIEVDANVGIVGKTIREKKPLLVNDAYSDPDFSVDVDKETGYTTHNIITAPIFNSNKQIIGVMELLNKEGGYSNEDRKFMIFFAHYVSGYLELMQKYNTEDR